MIWVREKVITSLSQGRTEGSSEANLNIIAPEKSQCFAFNTDR